MGGGEACIGVGVQNAGLRNPPLQQWGETIPFHLRALTAADENASPRPAYTTAEDAQLGRVSRDGVVLVVTQHNLAKPCTDVGHAMMLPALKLSLNGFGLRGHPLLRRDPPDDEKLRRECAPPKEVGKTQEIKRHVEMSPARLKARMESLSPFLYGSFVPYNMPVYPGALRLADTQNLMSASN
jgi:hypothetical protein